MDEPQVWSGQPMRGDALAVLVCAGTDWHLDVEDADGRHHVPNGKLSTFLRAHADCRLVCQHAGEFHAAVERALDRNDDEALAALWGYSGDGRLIDISLLQPLVADAQCWPRVDSSEPTTTPASEPAALLHAYRELMNQASEIVRKLAIEERAARFGPLGLTVEVQGRIAAHYLSRRELEFVQGARDRLQRACIQTSRRMRDVLHQDRAARRILDRGPDPAGTRPNDTVQVWDSGRLRRWLSKVGDRLEPGQPACQCGLLLRQPLTQVLQPR